VRIMPFLPTFSEFKIPPSLLIDGLVFHDVGFKSSILCN